MAKARGNQQPTKSLVLPFEKSSYKEAIFLYEKSGLKPQDWQKT